MTRIFQEEAERLEKSREELDWSDWFCPVTGGVGCAGPACPLFRIEVNEDEEEYDEDTDKEIRVPYSEIDCMYPWKEE